VKSEKLKVKSVGFANAWQGSFDPLLCAFSASRESACASKRFCQSLAKDIPRAANGFANVWQIRPIFAKHWQNEKTRDFRRASFTRHA
jgi:hypothetical protein